MEELRDEVRDEVDSSKHKQKFVGELKRKAIELWNQEVDAETINSDSDSDSESSAEFDSDDSDWQSQLENVINKIRFVAFKQGAKSKKRRVASKRLR